MKLIGNYTVEDIPIGSGGMGQVFKGISPDGSRNVAIKEILPNFVADIEYKTRIINEIKFLKRLNNDGIVKVYEHFEIDGKLYIVMELVEGHNIEQFVHTNGPIPWTDAVTYMVKILQAMQDVHEHGIVHRDVKPSNIMIRPNGDICLLDFGVAKDVSSNSAGGGTVIGTVIGTDGYMSYEQASGLSIDRRTDIYSLGCVLYFMITGAHAYAANSSFEILDAILNKPFPRINKKVKGVPASVQNVLDKATDKNMMKRFQSCSEFATELVKNLPTGTQMNTGMSTGEIKVSIGRENCEICVGVGNLKVSRHHADIKLKRFTGGEFLVYTDCSSNGTMINGQMLPRGGTYNIPRGDRPVILLAGDFSCQLDMSEVERRIDEKLALLRDYDGQPVKQGKVSGIKKVSQKKNKKQSDSDDVNPSSSEKTMTFGRAIKTCFQKYATFSGRASRAEFWWFYLFNFLVSGVISGVTVPLFLDSMDIIYMIPSYVYSLAVFFPNLAVTVRRLHDTGKSGNRLWLLLIPLANFIFMIMIFIDLVKKGDPNPNKYGHPTTC